MRADLEELAKNAEEIYATRLRDKLEKDHWNAFLAIEPISGEYFLGKTASEAASAAEKKHPDRLTHILRVGHEAAVEIGAVPWSEK